MVVSAYFTIALNIPFFSKVYAYLWDLEQSNLLFWIVIPLVAFAIFLFLLTILLPPKADKAVAALLILSSAMISWMEWNYGITFDHTMLDNAVQTNAQEAKTYLSMGSVSYVMLLGVIPAMGVMLTRIEYGSWRSELKQRLSILVASLAVVVVAAGGFYKQFADTGRNLEHVHQLLVPNQFIYSVGKFAKASFWPSNTPFKDLTLNAAHEHHSKTPELMVLLLGETARADHFQWNGYKRDVNRYTEADDFINLGTVESCGTSTAVSVPCMFSLLTSGEYSKSEARNQSNVLDIIAATDINVLWIDNNNGCKGVCDHVPRKQIPTDASHPLCDGDYCYDGILLEELDAVLAKGIEQDTLIVLHMIGSHGPTYYRRYPDAFRAYLPECARSDIQNCSDEEIINTYDNTLLYTDYVIAKSVELINYHMPSSPSGVLYISDHGESLGEHGLFLHGMPKRLAPREQFTVPELLWLSGEFKETLTLDNDCLGGLAKNKILSQDNFSHTLLGLLSVSTGVYNEHLDALSDCYSAEHRMQMSSKRSIATDEGSHS